jgi:hypothetical protein
MRRYGLRIGHHGPGSIGRQPAGPLTEVNPTRRQRSRRGGTCEGIRMPASDGRATYTGRRPKPSKERNRDGETRGGSVGAMGI